jgi:hypothetical protein
MNRPRSFVIRIYRQSHRTLVGQLEDVETGLIRPFHNVVELWRLLGGRGRPASKRGPDQST